MVTRIVCLCLLTLTLSACATVQRVQREVGWQFTASDSLRNSLQNGQRQLNSGQYPQALQTFNDALPLAEKEFGEVSAAKGHVLSAIALTLTALQRIDDAEETFLLSLSQREQSVGSDSVFVANTLVGLAGIYRLQARYNESEKLYRRALVIREREPGPFSRPLAVTLASLAGLYISQNRVQLAEPLLQRALKLTRRTRNESHPDVLAITQSLADLYIRQSKLSDAQALVEQLERYAEEAHPTGHPAIASYLSSVANYYNATDQLDKAESLLQRVLQAIQQRLGTDHPAQATVLTNLAHIADKRTQLDEALSLRIRAVELQRQVLSVNNPTLARSISQLSLLYWRMQRPVEALQQARRASDILTRYFGRPGVDQSGTERVRWRSFLLFHIRLEHTHGERGGDRVFELMQLARNSSVAKTLARTAARFAATDNELGRQIRNYQQGTARLTELDDSLLKVLEQKNLFQSLAGFGPANAGAALRKEINDLQQQLAATERNLATQFPNYRELTTTQTLSLAQVQSELAPNEAMLSYVVGKQSTYLWVLRRDRAEFLPQPGGYDQLNSDVQRLRESITRPFESFRQLQSQPFDTEVAHRLYLQLIAPAEPLLQGVSKLIFVPDGPLQSLPPAVLLTAPASEPDQLFDYQQLPWLIQRYAVSVLPSMSSLRALRLVAAQSKAKKPFIGFGDPVLEGIQNTETRRGLFTRDGKVDIEAVRQLEPLPESAEELRILAAEVGNTDNQNVYLRERATEESLRAAKLDDYRIIAFATHALVAGEISELAEPALVLTPASAGVSPDNDGLLTASEVTDLKLDADWVVLSACNTAADDGTPGAEALSGLARAFFFAGTRALLVSHWPVISDAAATLTTDTFRVAAAQPQSGRAEALRQAMLNMINAPDEQVYISHPVFWAPFVVVGEGGNQTKSRL